MTAWASTGLNGLDKTLCDLKKGDNIVWQVDSIEDYCHFVRPYIKKALEDIKQLSGLLPICSNCKKIRDDKGYWNQIEGYIRAHSEAEFSHGICPECAKLIYPDLDIYD